MIQCYTWEPGFGAKLYDVTDVIDQTQGRPELLLPLSRLKDPSFWILHLVDVCVPKIEWSIRLHCNIKSTFQKWRSHRPLPATFFFCRLLPPPFSNKECWLKRQAHVFHHYRPAQWTMKVTNLVTLMWRSICTLENLDTFNLNSVVTKWIQL